MSSVTNYTDKNIGDIFSNYSSHAMKKLTDTLVVAGLLNKNEDNDILKIGEYPTLTNTLCEYISISEDNSTYMDYKPSFQFACELSYIIQSNINSILKRNQQPMEESDIIAKIKKVKVLSNIDSKIIDPCIMKIFETMFAEEYINKVDTKYYKVTY
jgi:hypothetical protein